MSESKVFLACYDRGVTRAECSDKGEWSVEHVAGEHHVTCLANDPSNPSILYAGTRDGVLRSDDRGRTWRSAGMDGHIVKSLAVSPHDGTIFAGTKPAFLFVSCDGGESWSELDAFRRIPNRWWWFSPAEPPDMRPYVMNIAISPEEPEVLLAGIEFGAVVRSKDRGRTWSSHRRGALRDCHSLKFHPLNGNFVYEAGGTGGGASFSRDGGRTFQKAKKGLAKNYGVVCAADPGSPETWYLCVAPNPGNAFGQDPEVYLYRRGKGGSWDPIGWQEHPLKSTPTALVTVPGYPGHLYAGLKSGEVWHSSDYGDHWEQMPFHLQGIWFSLLII